MIAFYALLIGGPSLLAVLTLLDRREPGNGSSVDAEDDEFSGELI